MTAAAPDIEARAAGVRRMRAGILAAAAVFAALGVGAIVGAMEFPAPSTLGAPGPGQLPTIYGAALIALSAVLAAGALRTRPEPLVVRSGLRIVAFAALAAAFVGLLPYLGFLWLAAPWLLVAVRVAGGGWLGAALTAVILPASIYLIFSVALGVPLP